MPGFSHLKNELKTNLGLGILWNGICCKSAWSWRGEGSTHTGQSFFFYFFFSLLLCFLFFLFLHLLCFFLMGHCKTHTHTHQQRNAWSIFIKWILCNYHPGWETKWLPKCSLSSKFFRHPRRKCNPQFDHFYLFKGQMQISLPIP